MTCRMRFVNDNKFTLAILDNNGDTLVILPLKDHDVSNDSFTIIDERLFRVIKVSEEVLQYEESIMKSFENWNAMLETELLLRDGKIHIEVLNSLSILAERTVDVVPYMRSLKNRYLCIFDEDKNIIVLRDKFSGKSASSSTAA